MVAPIHEIMVRERAKLELKINVEDIRKMKSADVRQSFIKFFESKGHTPVSSSGLIPEDDNTLLFANAGMNQFKNVFLGLDKRSYVRAVSSQKCVRAGGKHNDLENVGFTARHHTFFEMLGNFSFGDYFKKEAIAYAWEFLTKTLAIPKDKLYVTVFESDDEAAEIWHKQEKVPVERISRFGEKDNFWRMGDTGPCGPCSEIFYDHGPAAGCGKKTCKVGCPCDRYVEIWNLVFMQFYEDESGKKTPLPKPSVDTGSGLERVTAAMQGKFNNYDTDLFLPMINTAAKLAGVKYVTDLEQLSKDEKQRQTTVALRVLADHSRATAFLIADGVIPTNEGRGYVLRRIMRRAIRYGRGLSNDQSLFPKIVASVIETMSSIYPELKNSSERILTLTKDEVSRFIQTLDQGTSILNDALAKLKKENKKILDGATVFRLYDTFGFPADLTELISREHEVAIDSKGFESEMQKARDVAKASWKGGGIDSDKAHLLTLSAEVSKQFKATQFTGYEGIRSTAKVLKLSDGKNTVQTLATGQTGYLVTDVTPFYAEGGGQIGDSGTIESKGGKAEVTDCTKEGEIFFHHLKVISGKLSVGDSVDLSVLESRRRKTMANHSATHLLHAALRKVLGTHVSQAGSHVNDERLRFDFTHNQPLSPEEIQKIETLVNQEIAAGEPVKITVTTPKKAVEEGALAFFGEKYGEQVRVIKMGTFSTELCGGTHVSNTSQILAFKLVSEGGVSAGVRRIEAITSSTAIQFLMKNTNEYSIARNQVSLGENWQQFLNRTETPPLVEWMEKAKSEIKSLEKDIKSLQSQKIDTEAFLKASRPLNGSNSRLVTAILELDDREVLSAISDKLKNKVSSGIVVVIGKGSQSHPIIVSVTPDLTAKIKAGDILKSITSVMGGKGGGRPDFAQGAGTDFSKAQEAVSKVNL